MEQGMCAAFEMLFIFWASTSVRYGVLLFWIYSCLLLLPTMAFTLLQINRNCKQLNSPFPQMCVRVQVTSPEDIGNAKRLIFPGVGSFKAAMDVLNSKG
jgi:hypothetical protein